MTRFLRRPSQAVDGAWASDSPRQRTPITSVTAFCSFNVDRPSRPLTRATACRKEYLPVQVTAMDQTCVSTNNNTSARYVRDDNFTSFSRLYNCRLRVSFFLRPHCQCIRRLSSRRALNPTRNPCFPGIETPKLPLSSLQQRKSSNYPVSVRFHKRVSSGRICDA